MSTLNDKVPGKSPGKSSPKFMKPFDLFMQRKKRKSCGLSPNGPRKKLFISPLKCIDLNSPEKKAATSPRISRRKQGTPVKTPQKRTPSKNKTPLKSRSIKCENDPPMRNLKSPRRKVAKRVLNFHSEEPRVSLSNLLDEDANIEAPSVGGNGKQPGLTRLPIDWTLKTRLGFTSTKPFPYKGYFSATESATGTTSFVRCLSTTVHKDATKDSKPSCKVTSCFNSSSSDSSASIDTSVAAILKKNCFVWRYPHLPGFDLFPRINNRCKVAPISKPMSEDLLHEYCSSLKDLFDLVKARQCAYFYLCAHSFTALFRAPGVGGIDDIHALITPTTEGFRKMLKEEGIEFTMPLFEKEIELEKEKEKSEQEKEKALNQAELQDRDIETASVICLDEDEDASNFLESLGVSLQESAPINKPKRNKSKKSTKSTLVMVTGHQTQELIPFLSNSKLILTTTGSLALVPPTLLAPVAFEGAQLHFLKLEQNTISTDSQSIYNLKIKGPILPSVVDSLCELFRTTVGDFKATLTNYDCTPLATVNSVQDNNQAPMKAIFATESLRDCGLPDPFMQDLCNKTNQSTFSHTMISCEKGKFNVK